MSTLFDQLQKQYTKKSIPDEKSFSNLNIFLNTSDMDSRPLILIFLVLSKKLGIGVKYSIFWITISGLTFQFLNPWATLIPAFFCLQGAASLVQGKR
jgi:hypothetical protein